LPRSCASPWAPSSRPCVPFPPASSASRSKRGQGFRGRLDF
jgi:hypothetical protein